MDDLKGKQKDENVMYQNWKKTGDKKHFQDLYTSMKPIIYSAAKKAAYGSNLPESAHRIWAAQNFMDALRTFDPKHGVQLSTHVYGAVHQKAKRLNYLYQNLGSMPEPRAQMVGLYMNEHENLKVQLGREPSAAEMADKLHVGIKVIESIQKELHKDLAMDEGTESVAFAQGSREEELLNYLYYDLASEEKTVYEYIFGKFGKPRLVKANNKIDFAAIAKKMGVSESKVRTVYATIRKKFEKVAK